MVQGAVVDGVPPAVVNAIRGMCAQYVRGDTAKAEDLFQDALILLFDLKRRRPDVKIKPRFVANHAYRNSLAVKRGSREVLSPVSDEGYNGLFGREELLLYDRVNAGGGPSPEVVAIAHQAAAELTPDTVEILLGESSVQSVGDRNGVSRQCQHQRWTADLAESSYGTQPPKAHRWRSSPTR